MFLSNINSLSEIIADKNLNQEDAEGVYITGINRPITTELLYKASDVSYDKTTGNPKPSYSYTYKILVIIS